MGNNQKKGLFKAQFNSIEINEKDPTILTGTVIIHDFLPSGNTQCIEEEVCIENMSTLVGKRIVCKYIPCEENNGIDALKEHEENTGKDRNTGEDILITDTTPIGFISEVYIDDYVDSNGNSKKALYGKVVIWNDDKYQNVVGLLKEWLERGIKIHMSVEYLYCNYQVIDGVEYILSPIIYVAHTILNSENRGEYLEVLPAYDDAQLLSLNDKKSWNKALNTLSKQNNNKSKTDDKISVLNKNNNKEDGTLIENKFYKALCELSHGDIREKIMTALSKTMTAEEFQYVWVSRYAIYDNYFVYEVYETDKYVNYKVAYTKTDTDVTIDFENKVKVKRDQVWVEVETYQQSQNALQEANNKIATLEKELLDKTEMINSANAKKEEGLTMEKFNELTNTITSLNSKVKEMQPIVEKYNKDQYKKSLNEAKEFYKEKFDAVDAYKEFETDEIQELIKKSVNSNKDEAEKAKFELSNKIINHVKVEKTKETHFSVNSITEPCTDNKNLRQDIDIFKETYGFSRE